MTALEPRLTADEAALALSKLGVTPEAGWSLASATPLCREVRRTSLEAAVKLKIRLWFSNLEQSVWRTLQGLAKAHDALNLLHEAACMAVRSSGSEQKRTALPSLPTGVFNVVAALQVYGKWVDDRSKLLKECKAIASLPGTVSDWSSALGKDFGALSKKMQQVKAAAAMNCIGGTRTACIAHGLLEAHGLRAWHVIASAKGSLV